MREVFPGLNADAVLAPVFGGMSADRPQHVAAFIAQGFGAGPAYSGAGSENAAMREMVQHHVGRQLSGQQRRRWVELLTDAADEAGLPANSRSNENPTRPGDHIPRWGWGSVQGPYNAVGSICQFPTDEEIIP